MSNPLWPPSLPQNYFLNTSGKRRVGYAEFSVDAGPALRRTVIRNPPSDINTPMMLTNAQRITFDTFYSVTLDEGALAFDWIDPVTLLPSTFRFMESVEWTQNPIATGTLHQGTMKLERL